MLPDDDRELLIHTRVYVIADYFNIVDLKVLCARKFGKQASSYWRGDTLVDAIADIYSIPFAPEHPMRKAVIKIAHEHLTELHQNMEFQRLLKEYAEFSAELIEAMLQPENRLSCEPVHLNNSVDISSMDTPQLEDSPMARVPDLLLETKVQPFPVRSPQERIEHISANSTFFFPPLWQAASDGNEASVRQLLERGADVNEMSSGESTALHIAACGGFEVVARLLLEKGADVNAKSRHGDTALHLAACYMHIGVARLLLEMGADVNAKSDNESTALFEALYSKDEAMMRLLLENGADAKAKNKYGYTVLYIATIRQYTTIVQLILEYGTGMETGDSCMSALVQKEVEEIVIEENAIETVGNNKLKGGLMKNQETAIETGDDNKLKGNTIFRNIKKLKNLQILK